MKVKKIKYNYALTIYPCCILIFVLAYSFFKSWISLCPKSGILPCTYLLSWELWGWTALNTITPHDTGGAIVYLGLLFLGYYVTKDPINFITEKVINYFKTLSHNF